MPLLVSIATWASLMSLEFELWPLEVVSRVGADVREAAGPAGSLSAEDARALRERIGVEFPEWPDTARSSFLEHVLRTEGVTLSPAEGEGSHGPAADEDAPRARPRQPRRQASRKPADPRIDWVEEAIPSSAKRLSAAAAGNGRQQILAIVPGAGHGEIRRTVWLPEGPGRFWHMLNTPGPTSWREKTPRELAADAERGRLARQFPKGGVWVDSGPTVALPHDLTAVAVVVRSDNDRTAMISTAAGESFVTRWANGEWEPRYYQLDPLDAIVDTSASSAASDHEELFAVTSNGTVHSTYWTTGRGWWSPWTEFPVEGRPHLIGVATASRVAGHQELVVLSDDGHLFHRWRWAHSEWEPEFWWTFGHVPGAAQVAAAGSSGGLVVAVANHEGVYVRVYMSHRWEWGEWSLLGMPRGAEGIADLAVVRDHGDSSATVIALTDDGRLFRRTVEWASEQSAADA
ncbi:hypothetical protein [Microbacterium lacticum]